VLVCRSVYYTPKPAKKHFRKRVELKVILQGCYN